LAETNLAVRSTDDVVTQNSDNFTIIDCCLGEDRQESILDDISTLSSKKGITRFISTHPDEDHIRGLELLDQKIDIRNFYVVKNSATKPDETESFNRYCELRDHEKKAFHISKGCGRKWMNKADGERGSSGIYVLWPKLENEEFKNALAVSVEGDSPNNISAVIQYKLNNGVSAIWMGDLETDFMEAVEEDLELPSVDILFAPHHGRDSGKIPESMLTKMSPKIIVVGEAPSEHLHSPFRSMCLMATTRLCMTQRHGRNISASEPVIARCMSI
jgi:beta-lactamase superfamily II metal-dependent hydrolase